MGLSLKHIVLIVLGLSLGCWGQNQTSNQPWFVPSGPGATTDWEALARYYAPFLIVPIVLGGVFSIILTIATCIGCFCSFKGPLCFNRRPVLVLLFTFWFLVIVAGGILTWIHAKEVSTGTDELIVYSEDAVSNLVDFVNKTKSQLQNVTQEFQDVMKPVINGTQVNSTSSNVTEKVSEVRSVMDNITNLINNTITPQYIIIAGGLTALKKGVPDYLTNSSVPEPSEVPNPPAEVYNNILTIYVALQVLDNQTSLFNSRLANQSSPLSEFNSSVPFNITELQDLLALPFNFSLPFNLSNGLDLGFALDKLLDYSGLADPLAALNETARSSLPFDIPSLTAIKTTVNQYGGVYVIVLAVLCGLIALVFLVWYPGVAIKFKPLIHAPFGCAALIIIPVGVLVGLHLGVGAATDGFCVNHLEYFRQGAHWLEQEAIAHNFTEPAKNITLTILSNPEKILSCSGNDTLFTLFNIDLVEDFGFEDKFPAFQDYLNSTGFKFPNFTTADYPPFPTPSPTDPLMATIYTNTSELIAKAERWQTQNINDMNKMVDVQNQLNSYNSTNNPTVASLNATAQNLTATYQQLNNSLTQLHDLLILLTQKETNLSTSRLEFFDSLFDNIKFPFFDVASMKLFFKELQGKLLDCAWVGEFYHTVIQVSLCSYISPGILWVGWAMAGVGIAMFLSFPIVLWSQHLTKKKGGHIPIAS